MRLPCLLHRIAVLALVVFTSAAAAAPEVPAPLDGWRGWALQDQAYRACPLIAGQAGAAAADFLCAWPGVLSIAADAQGANLSQHWQVDAAGWIPLAGDAAHWPQQVTVNGRPAVVVDRAGPALWLEPGGHDLRAHIPWNERPQSLHVPEAAGLVSLSIDGALIMPVQRSGDELTLGRASAQASAADSLEVRVYRHLADDLPAVLATRVELSVSGALREEIVGPALPAGFAPLSLEADWPARLDGEGRLRVRVQPGRAVLMLRARALAPLEKVTLRPAAAPWPAQEIWSYAANPQLRMTAASGPIQVDPAQAGVPAQWRNLPAFALAGDAALTIEQRSRGLAGEQRNRLRLAREMWLDFDGAGWFARDQVSGQMVHGWRLDAAAPYVLERAEAATGTAAALLVTRGAQPQSSGVEWRTPQVALGAGLRLEPGAAHFPILGWQDSFEQVDTQLHLPWGYRLLGAPGADHVAGSWMSRWTLLDVFLAAVLGLLAWRALGVAGGIAALAYLLLGYQEPGAPLWSLLAVLTLVLIARELPPGKLARATGWLRNAALLVLVLVALPFIAAQIRQAVYPQLEGAVAPSHVDLESPAPSVARRAPPPAPPVPELSARSGAPAAPPPKMIERLRAPPASDDLNRYAASTVMQTGAGEPAWQLGHRYTLTWSGPVTPAQEVRLVIAPPWLVRPLRIVLVALLAFLLLRAARPALRLPGRAAAPLLIAALTLASPALVPSAQAQGFPPQTLLDELRTRLSEAPECAPACATIASAEVAASEGTIEVALEIHAAHASAVPLPFDSGALTLVGVRVDGTPREGIARHREAWLLALPRGVHRVDLRFGAEAERIALTFPLQPMRLHFAGSGWQASGLANARLQGDTLTLVRMRERGAPAPGTGAQQFDPYVRVERTLELGLDWRVHTRVLRLAPREGGFAVGVPLLAGEHVSSAGVDVEDGKAQVGFASDQAEVAWTSSLDKGERLALVAPPLGARAEVWRLRVNPVWHLTHAGVPASAPEESGNPDAPHEFAFHPLPGETLQLAIDRPEAVSGATRAIDAVTLQHQVGQRAATSTLDLTMRASQGGEHAIGLPADAEVLAVSRNGELLNLRPREGRLSLPLVPGRQVFEIRFQQDQRVAPASTTPAVALELPAANIDLAMQLPQDRWLLATTGPAAGPAVLYWGELLVMLMVAFALSRLRRSPLRLHEWILLGLGFSTFSWVALLLVVAWLFALDRRAHADIASPRLFNLAQVGLALLTLVALACLFASIQHGLLGQPDMHVAGNGSWSQDDLRWFADQSSNLLPVARAISLPLWAYQLAMLAWALWLASALLRWVRRGFAAWMRGGYWRQTAPVARIDLPDSEPPMPGA
ncbi:hypothetical protein [Dokdonella sp.]|uniref:hypothetical protein n=1 Tax=Dokdonella sp. TaxID=2291710 RepID=UPI0031C51BA2|nr:hypothetical protein [Dokdonella sp.]